MKLHSDTLTSADVYTAMERAKQRGHVSRLTIFDKMEEKKSRTRKNGFEIHLEWIGEKVKGDGRRWTNSGKGGANSYDNGSGCYAATYDEWGWFIAELFDKDANAVFGHYKGKEHFDTYTKGAYML